MDNEFGIGVDFPVDPVDPVTPVEPVKPVIVRPVTPVGPDKPRIVRPVTPVGPVTPMTLGPVKPVTFLGGLGGSFVGFIGGPPFVICIKLGDDIFLMLYL